MAEAIEHARHDGAPGALVEPLIVAGQLVQARRDLAQARTHFEEALDMARAAGDVGSRQRAPPMWRAALVAEARTLEALLAESVRLSVESGDRGGLRARHRRVGAGANGAGEKLKRTIPTA